MAAIKVQYGLNNNDILVATNMDGSIVDDGKGEVFIPNEWIFNENVRLNKPKFHSLPWYYRLIPKEKLIKILLKLPYL